MGTDEYADNTALEEVKTLREVPRTPEHCGKTMRKLQGPSSTGGLVTVYACDTCGAQQRGERVRS